MFEWQEQYQGRSNDGVIDDFPKMTSHFPKISEDSPRLVRGSHERCRKFSENFRRLPKIAEDCRKLTRKTRRYFDHTPRNLSTIQETNLISAKASI